MPPIFLTEREAAQLLRVSVSYLRLLRRRGKVPYLRLGFGTGTIRYDSEQLIAAVRAMNGNVAGHACAKEKPQQ